ncbi:MAG: hypothetical protein AAGJ32_11105 [Pseudomonadota bacterium]
MNWWNRIRFFGPAKDAVDLDTFREQPYSVYSHQNDVITAPDEVYEAFTPDDRFPRSEFFEEYKAQVTDWSAQNLIALEEARRRIRAQISQWRANDALISVLIDHSGSLQGDKQIIAHIVANELDRSLLQSGVAFEMLGFTTRSWKGGLSRRTWELKGEPKTPGRLCDLMHIKYRAWEDRSETGNRYEMLLDPQGLKENVDGEAIDWAQSRFESSPYAKHLIVLVSDGAPVDDSTLMENHPSILVDHLKSKIEEYENTKDKSIIGFEVGFEVNDYYSTTCDVVSLYEIPATLETITSLMGAKLDPWMD